MHGQAVFTKNDHAVARYDAWTAKPAHDLYRMKLRLTTRQGSVTCPRKETKWLARDRNPIWATDYLSG
jgi:hypothetical protein